MKETIIETKKCIQCDASFDITDKDIEFYEKVSPVFGGKKYSIPTPRLCLTCRNQRRLSWRNERNLYKRKCDATGEDIISIYSPDKPFTVYNQDFRWSDQWNAMSYYLDIDFDTSFLQQFKELREKVPKRAVVKGTGSQNCDYVNFVGASKSCYLIFDASNNEKCHYSNTMSDCKNCSDSTVLRNSENCYEAVDSINCYNCKHIQSSTDCANSEYLFNCNNCSDCFGCVHLNNQSYQIQNKQYTKEEYKKELKKIKESGYIQSDFEDFKTQFPVKNLDITGSENVTGNIIKNSSEVKSSYEIYDAENIAYCTNIYRGARDCMDIDVGLNNSFLLYESGIINKICSNVSFCFDLWSGCQYMLYSTECKGCTNCFMCNGIENKQYCILNKQYTKEQYEKLVPKIIEKMIEDGEWGEFFPAYDSPFGYNETVANEYFPLTREEVLNIQLTPSPSLFKRGEQKIKVLSLEKGEDLGVGGDFKNGPIFNWSDYEAPFPKVEKIIPASKLPKNIEDIPDDILSWAIECEITKKPFRIIKPELEFYRKHNIAIPKRHPNRRHLDRMNLRNPRKLYERNCYKCKKDIQTPYAPERKETVYCEECYQKKVY